MELKNGLPVFDEVTAVMLDTNMQELTSELEKCKHLELSMRPSVPEQERRYTYVESCYFPTAFGYTFVVTLKDIETSKTVIISYPDICSFNYNHTTFKTVYIECLNRKAMYDLSELNEWNKLGTLTEEQAEQLAKGQIYDSYRIKFYREE